MKNEHIGDSLQPDQDPNLVAFEAQRSQLEQSHNGKWVAFVGGRLVISEENKTVLFRILDESYPEQDAFVHQIGHDEVDLGAALLF